MGRQPQESVRNLHKAHEVGDSRRPAARFAGLMRAYTVFLEFR